MNARTAEQARKHQQRSQSLFFFWTLLRRKNVKCNRKTGTKTSVNKRLSADGPTRTCHPSELRVLRVHRHLSLVTGNSPTEREEQTILQRCRRGLGSTAGAKQTPSFTGAPKAHSALELWRGNTGTELSRCSTALPLLPPTPQASPCHLPQ